jgi:hypothetical protein
MTIAVLSAAIFAAVFIRPARRADEYHALHTAGCADCAPDDEWLGL